MTQTAGNEAGHQPIAPEALERFQIHDEGEIRRLLQNMVDKRTFVNVHLGGGASFISAILAITVDGNGIILDASPDRDLNERATQTSALTCVTRLDRIQIQFALDGVEFFPHDGYPALRAALPNTVVRLQRREFYRLAVPISDPVYCTLTIRGNDKQHTAVPVKVLDISNGGIAIVAAPTEIPFEPGMEFSGCQLSIPKSPPVVADIKVRNVFHVDLPGQGSATALRAGCQFLNLPGKTMAQIQRYIFKVERDRRALETATSF